VRLLMEENPRIGWYGNPHRRKSRRSTMSRNPLKLPIIGRIVPAGVGYMDIAAASAGLYAVSIVPGMIVKDTATLTGKLLKLGAALATVAGIGMVAGSVARGTKQAAVMGGMAGFGLQALNAIRPGTAAIAGIGRTPVGRRIGASQTISDSFTREGERVSVLQP